MYAVIVTGGKQYRVSEGDTLKVEKLVVEAGETVEFDKILMAGEGDQIKVGAPYLDGSKVTAEVVSNGRGKKIEIIKFRRRKHSRTRQGHRQNFTQIRITGISA